MANFPIHTIVIHYTATPRGRPVTVEEIDRWHRERKPPFRKIGYHYVIYLDGSIHKGREDNEVGAHVANHNTGTLGICYVGGTDGDPNKGVDTRTPAQIDAMIRLIKSLLQTHKNARVVGHRDMPGASTQCPGFDVIPWWASVNNKPAPAPRPAPSDAPVRTSGVTEDPLPEPAPLPVDPLATTLAVGGVGVAVWNFFGWTGVGTVALAAIVLLFWIIRSRKGN